MGPLHIALNMAGQHAVSALSAHGQRVLNEMLKMLVSNASLWHDYTTTVITINSHNRVYKQ
jgi:hypothetical protein